MNHLGLFEGIGGFSLAASWARWKTKGWVEINPFCQTVLKYHFPEAQGFSDIKKFSYAVYKSILRNRGIKDRSIDIITGGFPCQPYSSAGLRKGTDDPRHLWPYMLETIRQFKPTWVVGENVRGITNWNGGLVFEQVQTELEAIGYEVQAFVLPACSVGAPHRRDRVWFVAYCPDTRAESVRRKRKNSVCEPGITTNPMPAQRERKIGGMEPKFVASCEWTITHSKSESPVRLSVRTETQHTINGEFSCHGHVADSDRRIRCQGRMYEIRRIQTERHVSPCGAWAMGDWKNFPTQRPIRERNDGLSYRMVRYLTNTLRHEINKTSEDNRIKNLQKVWEFVQQEEVWNQIRGLYSLESKDVLFQTMQLYSATNIRQVDISPFSEKVSSGILQHLRKYGEFRCSPRGRKLQEQRSSEFGDFLSLLPHEVALAARRFETAIAKFKTWHRRESIQAYGNAIVPQVAYQIFKAINEHERATTKGRIHPSL